MKQLKRKPSQSQWCTREQRRFKKRPRIDYKSTVSSARAAFTNASLVIRHRWEQELGTAVIQQRRLQSCSEQGRWQTGPKPDMTSHPLDGCSLVVRDIEAKSAANFLTPPTLAFRAPRPNDAQTIQPASGAVGVSTAAAAASRRLFVASPPTPRPPSSNDESRWSSDGGLHTWPHSARWSAGTFVLGRRLCLRRWRWGEAERQHFDDRWDDRRCLAALTAIQGHH